MILPEYHTYNPKDVLGIIALGTKIDKGLKNLRVKPLKGGMNPMMILFGILGVAIVLILLSNGSIDLVVCLELHTTTHSAILGIVFVLSVIPIYGILAFAQEDDIRKCYEKLDGQFCGLFDNPFEAISNTFLKEWIGDWYLVLVFIPFPISVIIITKNFTYGGFIGLIMTGTLETIYPTAFEIALTLVAISVGLVFVETIYKRIFD